MTRNVDIVVVGAGVVGACAALALSRLGAEVMVVERRAPGATAPTAGSLGEDLRTLALSPASIALLAELDVDETGWAAAGCAYGAMEVWDAEGTGRLRFTADEIGVAELGLLVPHHPLAFALWQALAREGIVCLTGASVSGMAARGRRTAVSLDDGSEVEAALVVAADGGESRVRTLAGIEISTEDTGQRAMATLAVIERPHENTAWQRFLPTGPLAFLPLPDVDGGHRVSVVWSLDTDRALAMEALADADFAATLGAAMEDRFGAVMAVDRRVGFPLQQRHARTYRAQGVVLVGDAAHVLHPLAGQGVNLGLQDVRVLRDELRRPLRGPGRAMLGDPDLLYHYERIRRGENAIMLRTMDGLKRLFAAEDPGVRWLRNEGLRRVGDLGMVKRTLLRQAMGLDSTAGEPA
ncbi:MAG: FAD-dependent oxidoreductase [Gammaproteobacteria bacterium]|nr:FAD-dependent oxidoreductase [Gammaproteobacteria bacterium]